jgi:cytochrome c oxidase subunit 2
MRSALQSALDPHGPDAAFALELLWIMGIGATLVLALVTGLMLYAAFARPERRCWLAHAMAVVAGGVVLPVASLGPLLAYGFWPSPQADAPPLRIEVTGEQWWWRVSYGAEGDLPGFETANEIRVPVGRPVEISLKSGDVIHSFWVPSLAGKVDMIPGRVNRLRIRADREGVLRGQCAEYCGGAHQGMALVVVAEPPERFDAWAANQRAPALEPQEPWLQGGKALFASGGCAACHRIAGTTAQGSNGPDLSHVGSRLSIGAGMLPNHRGTLAGWIAGNQQVKPGNHMPEFRAFAGPELRALAEYLESLK